MDKKENIQNRIIAPISEKLSAAGMPIPSSMTMRFNRRQFETIVLKQLPDDFFLVRQCLLTGPIGSVLAGFLADKIPSGVRVYRFVFPAFINAYDFHGNRDFHLGFSSTVPWPEDVIGGSDAQTTREISDVFLKRIEPWITDMRELKNLDALYTYFGKQEVSETHPVQQAMGYTQILRDEPESAENHLRAATSVLESFDGELRDFELTFLEETKHFIDLLQTERVAEAKSLLYARVADLKAGFKIFDKQAVD